MRQAGTLFPRTLRGPSRSDALGIPVLGQLGRAAVKRWIAQARAPSGKRYEYRVHHYRSPDSPLTSR